MNLSNPDHLHSLTTKRRKVLLLSNIRLHDFHRVDHRQISILIKSRFLRERERLSRSALNATPLKFNYMRRSMKWSNTLRPPPPFPCLLIIVKFIFVWSLIARCNRVSTATFLLIYPSTARRGFVLSFSRARHRIYS